MLDPKFRNLKWWMEISDSGVLWIECTVFLPISKTLSGFLLGRDILPINLTHKPRRPYSSPWSPYDPKKKGMALMIPLWPCVFDGPPFFYTELTTAALSFFAEDVLSFPISVSSYKLGDYFCHHRYDGRWASPFYVTRTYISRDIYVHITWYTLWSSRIRDKYVHYRIRWYHANSSLASSSAPAHAKL